jgi:exosortase H (IPTLxxWG-CTERM-specific)
VSVQRLRFLAVFALILIAFEVALLVPAVDQKFSIPFSAGVAYVSSGMLRLFGEHVTASGTLMNSPCAAVDIRNGCNGIEVTAFVAAAVLAFSARWKYRLLGAIAGVVLLQIANLARVVTLYALACHQRAWFDTFHIAVWQSAMFALAIGYFLVWSRRAHVARPA